jgi:hypothetical protein
VADQPIRRRENHIHGSDGCAPRLFDQTDYAGQQFTIWNVGDLGRAPLHFAGLLFTRLRHELRVYRQVR